MRSAAGVPTGPVAPAAAEDEPAPGSAYPQVHPVARPRRAGGHLGQLQDPGSASPRARRSSDLHRLHVGFASSHLTRRPAAKHAPLASADTCRRVPGATSKRNDAEGDLGTHTQTYFCPENQPSIAHSHSTPSERRVGEGFSRITTHLQVVHPVRTLGAFALWRCPGFTRVMVGSTKSPWGLSGRVPSYSDRHVLTRLAGRWARVARLKELALGRTWTGECPYEPANGERGKGLQNCLPLVRPPHAPCAALTRLCWVALRELPQHSGACASGGRAYLCF